MQISMIVYKNVWNYRIDMKLFAMWDSTYIELEGGCRTVDDTKGLFSDPGVSSQTQCQAACDEELSCTAYEYRSDTHDCEIHLLEITQASGQGVSHCYIKADNTGKMIFRVLILDLLSKFFQKSIKLCLWIE